MLWSLDPTTVLFYAKQQYGTQQECTSLPLSISLLEPELATSELQRLILTKHHPPKSTARLQHARDPVPCRTGSRGSPGRAVGPRVPCPGASPGCCGPCPAPPAQPAPRQGEPQGDSGNSPTPASSHCKGPIDAYTQIQTDPRPLPAPRDPGPAPTL